MEFQQREILAFSLLVMAAVLHQSPVLNSFHSNPRIPPKLVHSLLITNSVTLQAFCSPFLNYFWDWRVLKEVA